MRNVIGGLDGVQKGPSNRLGLLIEKKKEKRKKI